MLLPISRHIVRARAGLGPICKLRDYRVPSDLKTLAAAHAELGEFATAVRWQTKVVELTNGEAQTTEQELLKLYTAGEPFRFLKAVTEEK